MLDVKWVAFIWFLLRLFLNEFVCLGEEPLCKG